MTALAWTSFVNQHEQGPSKAFQPSWWFWLAATGVSLGATFSVKWVGLFTIAWVGSLTLVQLWVLLGDTRTVTPRLWFKHFFARVFCLICIPVAFYMLMFGIHFICLVNPGDGDGFMSSEFQATLNKNGAELPSHLVETIWNIIQRLMPAQSKQVKPAAGPGEKYSGLAIPDAK